MPSIRTFRKNGFNISVPFYTELLAGFPGGCLPHDPAAHALWDYFTRGSATWSDFTATHNKMEGVVYKEPDMKQLFLSLAKMHDVDPSEMGQFWPVMYRQRVMLGISMNAELPHRFHFTGLRFESVH